jgi:DNA-binding response OmpR family regulator
MMGMKAKILLVEGNRSGYPSFSIGLSKKGFLVETAPNGNTALERLEELDPDMVIVNAPSLRTSGLRICETLHKAIDGLPILLIVEEGKTMPGKVDADLVLPLPFTIQKLYNRIRPLLPADEKDMLRSGPIRLNLEQKRVRCQGRQARLTPNLVRLLKYLMEHANEVVGREALFSTIWDTQYTEDTRTLDVHISWLRRAIEADPRHPRFLKTIRGVGYRLDV